MSAAIVIAAAAVFLKRAPAPGDGAGTSGAEPAPVGEWRTLRLRDAGAALNVVLVTIDTLRADRLGSYGGRVLTPHLDRLAAEGARFANAATTVPFTLPAHSSIMTGVYPPAHGVRENVGYALSDGLPTLAELLQPAGYARAGFVSAFVLDARFGIGRGFDPFYDDFDLRELASTNLGDVQRDGEETLRAAVAWLDRRPAGPFLLWLHLFDPHDPYQPKEPWRSQYPGRPYDAEVAYTDALIGELRAALASRSLLERSLLVVTGDHGEGLGDHGERYHGFFVYDSTAHVPLIVRTPYPELAGRVVEQPVSHVDLLPTILEAVGVAFPTHLHGRSLLPLLAGRAGVGDDRLVYTESLYALLHYGWAPLRAVRDRDHKLIAAPRPELYHLRADPGEQADLAAGEHERTSALAQRLAELRQRIESTAGDEAASDLDEATLQQLAALGYVAGRGEAATSEQGERGRADPKDKLHLHQAIMEAQSALAARDSALAERRLLAVLAEDRGIVDAWQLLGGLYGQNGDHARAAEHLERALALDPDHRTSLFLLAGTRARLGDERRAREGYARLLELAPSDSKATLALARLEAGVAPERAIALLEAATRRPGAPAILLNELGELLATSGRGGDAVAAFERAVAGADDLAQPLFNLAALLEERGEAERAIALYLACIARAPKHYQAQFNLGRLYGARGDLPGQRHQFEAAIASNPEFARGYFFLAKSLMDEGRELERAERLARAGLARDPEHKSGALGFFVLADILNRRGDPRGAEAALERAAALERRG